MLNRIVVAVFALSLLFVVQHHRRPGVFAVLTLAVVAGVTFGYTIGMAVGELLKNSVVLLYCTSLLVFCGCLMVMPWLSRYISAEMGWDRRLQLFFGSEAPVAAANEVLHVPETGNLAKKYHPIELSQECRLLSKREAEIASLLVQRLSATEMASLLQISPRTVERHIANIYEKLKVTNRRELILKLLPEK